MYRITVTGAQATDREYIALGCVIEQSDDGENWVSLEGAPSTIALPLSHVQGALRVPSGLAADQRAALLDLVRKEVRRLPVMRGVWAIEQIEDLLPAGWPVTVAL